MVASTALASDADPWFGRDKALHFGASATIAAGGYAITTALSEAPTPRWKAFAVGGALAISAGAFKETLDAMGYGDPSWRDFTWDVIGTAFGLGVAFGIDALVRPRHDGSPSTATAPLLFRF